MSDTEKLQAVVAMVDEWMSTVGPGTETERVMGTQLVSVAFVHRKVHEIAG